MANRIQNWEVLSGEVFTSVHHHHIFFEVDRNSKADVGPKRAKRVSYLLDKRKVTQMIIEKWGPENQTSQSQTLYAVPAWGRALDYKRHREAIDRLQRRTANPRNQCLPDRGSTERQSTAFKGEH
ncbi:hypothetical protein QE152_g34340 [Popillia japonica]|uniref:Uncharacterized protein n=1 Tax=Popillia japonica TaxID=7064 RepID=A0AAW1ITE6_POPJA